MMFAAWGFSYSSFKLLFVVSLSSIFLIMGFMVGNSYFMTDHKTSGFTL